METSRGGDHATWLGFKRPFPDIARIEVDPASTPGYDNFGIDNIHYNTTFSIDINPVDDANIINLRSKNISVAILSFGDFYAPSDIEVDLLTLTFGVTGDEQSLLSCATRKPRDVDGDGTKDLVCKFSTKDTGFQCGDKEGILRSMTTAGNPLWGRQVVVITPCK